jgi:hypothetical protein
METYLKGCSGDLFLTSDSVAEFFFYSPICPPFFRVRDLG